jgi:hypothetical protein
MVDCRLTFLPIQQLSGRTAGKSVKISIFQFFFPLAITRSQTAMASHGKPKTTSYASVAIAIYALHTILETVLGMIKMRGRYSGDKVAGPQAKFIRHHGIALLSLALLGGLVWRQKLIETPTGRIASSTLCFFHAGAALVHVHAFVAGSTASAATAAMHLPFAVAFLFDVMRR